MKQHNTKGLLITLEGIEGVGKTCAVKFVKEYFDQLKIPNITSREPGGTPIAESIRQVLLQQYNEPMAPNTELLLMFASRAQHIANVILPALNSGKIVICDRFTDASYAYQGGGRGIDLARIEILENWVQGKLRPDLTILLDAPVQVAFERIKQRKNLDRIETEQAQFFERVRQTYLQHAQSHSNRYIIVDATQDLETVQTALKKVIDDLLSRHHSNHHVK